MRYTSMLMKIELMKIYNEIKNYCTFCFLLLFAVVVGMVGTVVIGGFVDMATGVNL